jgi:hypothetical protein
VYIRPRWILFFLSINSQTISSSHSIFKTIQSTRFQPKLFIMKTFFSTLTVAALCALAAAAPTRVSKRSAAGPLVTSIAPSAVHIIDENQPNVDVASQYDPGSVVISRSDTTLDIDTIINFWIPALADIPGATSSSTCDFKVYNAGVVSGSQTLQLFTTVTEADLTGPLTFNTAPSSNQYEGMYFIQAGAANSGSVAIDVSTFPCEFGSTMQFIVRPQNDNDFIAWTAPGAGATPIGAFIEIRN